jgi:hypothetical protein
MKQSVQNIRAADKNDENGRSNRRTRCVAEPIFR